MSGHSKWSTIKHKKGAKDLKRGKAFSKIIRDIVVAVREGGGDEFQNPSLRTVLAKAREINLPKDTISRALARGTGAASGENYERITFEGYGPGGVAIIVETLTDNRRRTVSDVRHTFTKFGGNLGATGCVSWMFERKGLVKLPVKDVDEDTMMEQVIESGAEDFEIEEDEYSVAISPDDFPAVKGYFKEKGYKLLLSDIRLVPKTTVHVGDEKHASVLLRLLFALDDLDDVDKVHSNMQVDDEIVEKISFS